MAQPRNRAVGDIVGAGNIAHRLSGIAAAEGLLRLMRCQLRRQTHLYATGFGTSPPLPGPRADQLALKLGGMRCTAYGG